MMDNNKFSISIFNFFQNVYIIKFHITTVINEYFYLKRKRKKKKRFNYVLKYFSFKREERHLGIGGRDLFY